MELWIVGSGCCIPTKRRGAPGYILGIKGEYLLLDGGSGTLYKLPHLGIDFRRIHYLLYTHFHPDHTADLVPLLFALKNEPRGPRQQELSIIGPSGLKKFWKGLQSLYQPNWLEELPFRVELWEVARSQRRLPSFHLKSSPVRHTETSVAFRIESDEGVSLVYSGDSGYCQALVELAQGAEVLLLEASLPEGEGTDTHLTPSQAGRIAHQAGSKSLILTHFYPQCDQHNIKSQAATTFQGEIIVAEDGMKLNL